MDRFDGLVFAGLLFLIDPIVVLLGDEVVFDQLLIACAAHGLDDYADIAGPIFSFEAVEVPQTASTVKRETSFCIHPISMG